MDVINKHEKSKDLCKEITRRINKKDYKDAIYWTGFLIQALVEIIEQEEIKK